CVKDYQATATTALNYGDIVW
nr:immunoglobulin heavy chain junction region [Macaca mulatta]